MNYCVNCGNKLDKDSNYCAVCGNKLQSKSSVLINKTRYNWGAFSVYPLYMLVYEWPIGIVLFVGVLILNFISITLLGHFLGGVIAQLIFWVGGIYFLLNGESVYAISNWKRKGKDDTKRFIRIQYNWNIVGIIIFIIEIISTLAFIITHGAI